MNAKPKTFTRDLQFVKFCAYGFLKNLRFYEPFFMLFLLEKQLSFAQIGLLYGVRELAINLIEIPSGVMADVLGRKKTMLVSFLAYIVAFLGFFFIQSYWALFIPMVLYAFGDAFRTGTHKAMIFDYLAEHNWSHLRTEYYGRTRAWSQRGAALSALIAGALVFWQGSYGPVFLFTLIPYTLDFLLILSYPQSLDGQGSRQSNSFNQVKQKTYQVLKDLKITLSSPKLLKAIGQQSLYSGFYKGAKDFLQPMIQTMALSLPFLLTWSQRERTAVIVALLYSLLYFATSWASQCSGSLASRFTSVVTPLNGTLFAGVGFGVAAGLGYLLGYTELAVVMYLGIFIMENLRKPMGIDYVSGLMSQTSMASGLSVESQAETLFAALFAVILGFFADIFGVAMAILIMSGVTGALGLVLKLPSEPMTGSE
jgi:MFS family permease